MSTHRFMFIITILILALAATGSAIWLTLKSHRGAIVSVLDIGGPFSLLDHTGKRVTEADYAGRVQVIFFGYTYCPDICPTELSRISAVMDALGDAADHVVPIFVTVDPDRDTVEVMRDYQQSFHPGIQMLTGKPAEIAAMQAHYRVYAQRVGADENYLMDHSSNTFLMDRAGTFVTHFTQRSSVEDMTARLRAVVEKS